MISLDPLPLLFFSFLFIVAKQCTEKRRQNKEVGKTRKFVSTTALVMQMKLRRCRNFYVFFHAGQSKFFGSLSNRARRKRHDEIIDRRVIFYFFFFFLSPLPRVRNFERHWDNNLKNYGDRKKILSI